VAATRNAEIAGVSGHTKMNALQRVNNVKLAGNKITLQDSAGQNHNTQSSKQRHRDTRKAIERK